MKEKVNINKNVFDKTKFRETVDTTFSQLVTKPSQKFFDVDLATIPDFWLLYDRFFYEIPKLGETESREYLSQTSGEYANYTAENEDIQALLDEIASLREDLLEANKTIVELEIENSTTGGDTEIPTVT